MMNVGVIFAQDSTGSPPTTQNSPSTVANKVCTTSDCNKFVQAILIELDRKTGQVKQLTSDKAAVTKERDTLQADRNEWHQLYLQERQAGNKLAASNLDYVKANGELLAQRKLDEAAINAQNRTIRRLKIEKWVYTGASFAGGFGIGYVVKAKQDGVSFSF